MFIFGMQPYSNQSRWNVEDDLKFFHMEDILNMLIEDDLKGNKMKQP